MTPDSKINVNYAARQLFQYAWTNPPLRHAFLPVAVLRIAAHICRCS